MSLGGWLECPGCGQKLIYVGVLEAPADVVVWHGSCLDRERPAKPANLPARRPRRRVEDVPLPATGAERLCPVCAGSAHAVGPDDVLRLCRFCKGTGLATPREERP